MKSLVFDFLLRFPNSCLKILDIQAFTTVKICKRFQWFKICRKDKKGVGWNRRKNEVVKVGWKKMGFQKGEKGRLNILENIYLWHNMYVTFFLFFSCKSVQWQYMHTILLICKCFRCSEFYMYIQCVRIIIHIFLLITQAFGIQVLYWSF